MKTTDMQSAVLEVLSGIAPETEPGAIKPDRPLRDQIDLDSMDWLNFLIALHERLKVDIPESDYAQLTTLNAISEYLSARIASA